MYGGIEGSGPLGGGEYCILWAVTSGEDRGKSSCEGERGGRAGGVPFGAEVKLYGGLGNRVQSVVMLDSIKG